MVRPEKLRFAGILLCAGGRLSGGGKKGVARLVRKLGDVRQAVGMCGDECGPAVE
jgi:hypothetical protein